MAAPLVFDIGFHDGSDTEYYLSRGFDVVAVEANPEFVSAGRTRFHRQISSGQLTLYHAAVVAERDQPPIKLYINHRDSGSSSTREAWRGDDCHEVEVQCVTLAELMATHGVPLYLKVDIEGMDEEVVASIPAQSAPAYLSCEVAIPGRALETLIALGYTGFKLINQVTFTQSFELSDEEITLRSLRKLGAVFPPFERVLRALPDSLRPPRVTWDSFRERFPYAFPKYSSGPCGEETFGPWRSASRVRRSLQLAGKGANRRIWFDLHARHGRMRHRSVPRVDTMSGTPA